MSFRQRGAGMLMAVLLILTVAAFAVLVAASQSGGDIQATDANADSLQALFLAEAGIERQLKRFATGTACAALGDNPATGPVEATHTITDLSTIGLGAAAYSITLVNGLTTDFAGAALPTSQCRVAVTARVIANNVARTLHAIVDRNLLEGPDNPTFDNPLTGAAPSAWTALNPANAFAANGGPDGTAPNCRRSAWTAKQNPAAARRATGQTAVQFTLTAGSVTNITFHRRIITRPNDCPAASLPGAGAALPGACGAGSDSTVCFVLIGTGGAGTWTIGSNAATAGAGVAGVCPSPFNPCQTSYQVGYPTKVSVNVTMTGATSVNTFRYHLQVQGGGRKELFLDSIEVINPTAVGAAYVKVWRDCSTVANPVTCV
jgi:hypothetical protein